MGTMKGKREARGLIVALLALCLLAGCGKKSAEPAPAPTPVPPAAAAAETALPVTSPADGLLITGPDGALRASLTHGAPQTEREGQLVLRYRLKNESTLALTMLRLELNAFDAEGRLLNRTALPVTFSLLEEPLQPGEEREIVRQHYFTGAEKAVSVQLKALEVQNEAELPPWNPPQPNNLLPVFCNDQQLAARFAALDTELPVLLRYQWDQEPVLEVDDPEIIRAAADALSRVRIGAETGKNVDDGGFSYTFVMADGSEWGVQFDFRDVFYWHGKNYEVLDAEELLELELQPEEEANSH